MRGEVAPVDLCRDQRLDPLSDCIGIVAPISQEGLDPIGYHAEKRDEALHIVRLAACQREAKREASGITTRLEFGGEPTARSANRLG
jgi:hypothetical protein